MKIGFFDSGLGGLIVLKAVTKLLPQYDYEFYGDTANVPYGDKTEVEILKLTKAGILHLFERGCLLVIVACNTASAETLRALQDSILVGEYKDHRILGVIIPTVEQVIKEKSKKVTLIATSRTVNSKKYDREFAKFKQSPELLSVAEPRLVSLIESDKEIEAKEIIKSHVEKAVSNKSDALILGCTHFSLLKEYARDQGGGVISIISQDEIIPERLNDYLKRHQEIENRLTKGATRSIFLTEATTRYDHIIANMLGGAFLKE